MLSFNCRFCIYFCIQTTLWRNSLTLDQLILVISIKADHSIDRPMRGNSLDCPIFTSLFSFTIYIYFFLKKTYTIFILKDIL
jgi:hypothetical protein